VDGMPGKYGVNWEIYTAPLGCNNIGRSDGLGFATQIKGQCNRFFSSSIGSMILQHEIDLRQSLSDYGHTPYVTKVCRIKQADQRGEG
jgi:hypothetical protein